VSRRYEIRWGDDRGNSTRLDLPGALESELVVQIARGVRRWWKGKLNYNEKWFVEVTTVEERTHVMKMDFE
jgi:hypothetical protein